MNAHPTIVLRTVPSCLRLSSASRYFTRFPHNVPLLFDTSFVAASATSVEKEKVKVKKDGAGWSLPLPLPLPAFPLCDRSTETHDEVSAISAVKCYRVILSTYLQSDMDVQAKGEVGSRGM